jgi:hypothetical protein
MDNRVAGALEDGVNALLLGDAQLGMKDPPPLDGDGAWFEASCTKRP